MGWHVITAGPSAGKTSVIRELSARGHRTAPEGARIVIDQAVSEGVDVKEWRTEHPQDYQDKVIDTDLRIQRNLPDGEDVFMDRSVADNIAYARLTDRELPDNILEYCQDTYDTVFLLEQIPFEDDYARTEDEKMADDVHEELRDVYESLGYTVIEVDLMPVDRRVDFIEHCVRQGPPAIH
jgi:predicted ATPase